MRGAPGSAPDSAGVAIKESNDKPPPGERPDRREFLASASSIAMGTSLVLAYGTCGVMAARYLYPSRPGETRWQFVTRAEDMRAGESLEYRSPSGETVTVARRAQTGGDGDFVALSSTCPHLGCQVHWEAHRERFFCPCHNGVFDPSGQAVSGPPADAGQSLPEYPVKVEEGLLYIQVPIDRIARSSGPEGSTPA